MIWRSAAIGCVALLAVAVVPAVRHLRETPPAPPPAWRAALLPPDGAQFGTPDHALDAALSTDGRQVAFVATDEGRVRLWVRRLDEPRATPLPGTEGATLPAWKPGDRALAFFAGGRLRQVSLADGAVRDLAAAPAPAGAAWQADGSLLFTPDANGPIRALRGGVVTAVTELAPGERGHRFPDVTAEGNFVYLVERTDGTRVIRRRRGDEDRELARAASHGQIVDNHLLYVRDATMLAQRLDPETAMPSGRPVPLDVDVGVSPTGHGFFAASSEALMTSAAARTSRALIAVDPASGRRAALTEPGDYWQVRAAPGGKTIALTAIDPLLRTLDVFLVPFASPGDARRLSLGIGADRDPVWAPDGGRVVYRSTLGSRTTLLARAVSPPTAPETSVLEGVSDETPTDWRGDQVLFHARGATTGLDLWVADVRSGERSPVVEAGFNQWDARWSPDGRAIAFVSDESGTAEVYVASWPGLDARRRVTFAGGTRPQWDRTGRHLFLMRLNSVMRTPRPADGFAFPPPEPVIDVEGLQDFALDSTGNRLFVLAGAGRAQGRATLILNWRGAATGAPTATR